MQIFVLILLCYGYFTIKSGIYGSVDHLEYFEKKYLGTRKLKSE